MKRYWLLILLLLVPWGMALADEPVEFTSMTLELYQPQVVPTDLPPDYQLMIEERWLNVLRDPDSARFVFAKPFEGTMKYRPGKFRKRIEARGQIVCGYVRARNAYGGMEIENFAALFKNGVIQLTLSTATATRGAVAEVCTQ